MPPADVTTGSSPDGSLGLSLFAVPYLGAAPGASVLVGAEVSGLSRAASNAGRRLELRYEVVAGTAAVQDQQLVVDLSAVTPAVLDEGVRSLTRFALAPGMHTVRLTVRDGADSRTGTLTHPIDVPDLFTSTSTIGASGMAVAVSPPRGTTHADADEEHRRLPIVLAPPTTRRTFSQGELVEVHVEFYDWQDEFDVEQGMTIATRVRSADGTIVYSSEDTGGSEALTSGRYGYAHSALIPVRRLAPATYAVEVQATSLSGDQGPVTRAVPITIVAADAAFTTR